MEERDETDETDEAEGMVEMEGVATMGLELIDGGSTRNTPPKVRTPLIGGIEVAIAGRGPKGISPITLAFPYMSPRGSNIMGTSELERLVITGGGPELCGVLAELTILQTAGGCNTNEQRK